MQRTGSLALIVISISVGNLASQPARAQERSLPDPASVVGRAIIAPTDAYTMAREVQKELYRLGCYDEAINGVWTSSSRSAAQKFLERINARLPVDKPDDALLALLRNSKGFICSQCPPGEALNGAGHCLPKALIEKASKPVVPATGTLPEASSSIERAAKDAPAEQREVAGGEQHTSRKSTSETKYWRSMLRKVDRALGLY